MSGQSLVRQPAGSAARISICGVVVRRSEGQSRRGCRSRRASQLCAAPGAAAPTASPPSPMCGNTNTSSTPGSRRSRRLTLMFEATPPASAMRRSPVCVQRRRYHALTHASLERALRHVRELLVRIAPQDSRERPMQARAGARGRRTTGPAGRQHRQHRIAFVGNRGRVVGQSPSPSPRPRARACSAGASRARRTRQATRSRRRGRDQTNPPVAISADRGRLAVAQTVDRHDQRTSRKAAAVGGGRRVTGVVVVEPERRRGRTRAAVSVAAQRPPARGASTRALGGHSVSRYFARAQRCQAKSRAPPFGAALVVGFRVDGDTAGHAPSRRRRWCTRRRWRRTPA